MSNEIVEQSQTETLAPRDTAVMPGFNSNNSWELAQRIGKAFAASSLVPATYQNNLANCIVALEMANRMGASPLMVMQNLYIVHGNPGWSSKFLIASFNQCGRFSAMRYEWNEDRSSCRAWATEKGTGEKLVGPAVTLAMAKDEGWSTKAGSKWKTMPELMLMYRSAAFFVRTYAPEISMGLRTDDELIDTVEQVPQASAINTVRAIAAAKRGETPATPLPDDTGSTPKTFAEFADAIQDAPDASIAGLILDEAGEHLPADQMVELNAVYDRAYPKAVKA